MRLEMVEIDHNRFAAEIYRSNASINLTQMAKPFGRSFRPSNWLRTDEAKRYLAAVAVAQKCARLIYWKLDRVERRKCREPGAMTGESPSVSPSG